jgi:hypothetical protein
MAAFCVPCCLRSTVLLGLVLFPVACGHVPLMSMVTLSRVDFATTDPALLRAAIKLPQVIEPRLNGATLRVAVKLADGSDLAQDFKLSETTDERDVIALHAELDPGTRVFAYRIEPGELERLKAFRRTALAQKQGQRAGLEISIKPDACRAGPLPPGALLMTTYIKTSETNRYVTLARDVDLRTLAAGRDAAAAIPVCR